MVLPDFPNNDPVVSDNKGNLKDDNAPKYREESAELPVDGAGAGAGAGTDSDAENNNDGRDERTANGRNAYGFGIILRDFFPSTNVAQNQKWVPLTRDEDEEWVPGRWVAVIKWERTERAYLVYRIPDQVLTYYSCQMLETLNKLSGDISFHRPEQGFFPLVFWNPTYGYTKNRTVRDQPHPWPCRTLLKMEDYVRGGKFMVEYSELDCYKRLNDSEVRVLADHCMTKQSHLREDAVSKVNECWECEDGGELMICCGNEDVKGCGKCFHRGCVGLEHIPHGNWICSECAGRNRYGKQGFTFSVASDSDDNKRKNQDPPNNCSDKKAKNDNGLEHKDESTGEGGEHKAGLPVDGAGSGNENGGNDPDGAGNHLLYTIDDLLKLLTKNKHVQMSPLENVGVQNGTSGGNEENNDGEESAGNVSSVPNEENNDGEESAGNVSSVGIEENNDGEESARNEENNNGEESAGNVSSVRQMFTFQNFEWDDIYEQAHEDRNKSFSIETVKGMWSFRVGSNAGMESVANIGEFKCSYKDSPRKALSLALWLGGTDLSGGGTQVYRSVHGTKPNQFRFELPTVDGVCLEEVQPTICTLSELLSIDKNTTDKEWAKFPQILEVCSKTTRMEKKKGWEFLSAFVVYIPAKQWLFVVENDSEKVELIALGTKTINQPDTTINKKIGGKIFPAEGKHIDKRVLEVLQVRTVKWKISEMEN